MKQANVYVGNSLAGVLAEDDLGYEFRYDSDLHHKGTAPLGKFLFDGSGRKRAHRPARSCKLHEVAHITDGIFWRQLPEGVYFFMVSEFWL